MRKSRIVGLVFLATATLAQQPQSVEITSEPSHHLVFQNEYVRVFDVTVAPKTSTLVHRHNYDYIFVTLGDSDVVSVRPGEKPVSLLLKDGEVRFTPGNFAHAAINNSAQPFHNITIELLKPSSNVKTCTESCLDSSYICGGICPERKKLISADQWSAWIVAMPPTLHIEKQAQRAPQLVVPVSDLDVTNHYSAGDMGAEISIKRAPGQIDWQPAGLGTLINKGAQSARFVVLEFHPEKPSHDHH